MTFTILARSDIIAWEILEQPKKIDWPQWFKLGWLKNISSLKEYLFSDKILFNLLCAVYFVIILKLK